MIVIGRKPRIRYVGSLNDMSHFFPSHFVVDGDFVLVSDEMYLKLKIFCDPVLKEYEKNVESPAHRGFENQKNYLQFAISQNPGGKVVWEYNALSLNYKDYIRKVALLGETIDERIKWWERLLLYPFLCVVCAVLNGLNWWKAQYEKLEWEKYLSRLKI